MKRPGKTRPTRSTAATRPVESDLTDTEAKLAWAAESATPPPAVRERLLARVRATKAWKFIAADDSGAWLTMPFPGVRIKELSVDASRDTAMLLIEMAPGSRFPDHEHTADERGYVLTGDLTMAGRALRAGDFYEAAAGTRHERVISESGCTGLLWVGATAWKKWRALAIA